jgi:hypothetical protein
MMFYIAFGGKRYDGISKATKRSLTGNFVVIVWLNMSQELWVIASLDKIQTLKEYLKNEGIIYRGLTILTGAEHVA